MQKKKFLHIILPLCIAALAACGKGGGETTVTETPPAVISKVTETTEADTETSEKANETESEIVPDVTDVPDTETEESPEETSVPEDTAEASAETVSETVKTEEKVTVVTTEKPAETTAKTTAATTAKPPVNVVIPDVKIPLADGTKVISGTGAEIDYSGASEGYISAVYTGKAKQAKLRVACGSTQYDHDLAVNGTREFFPLMGSGSYTVKVYEQVSGTNYQAIATGDFSANVKNDTVAYLYPNKYVNFSKSSKCVKKAAELCAGKNSEVEKIGAIFDFVAENTTYDKQLAATVKGGYIPDPDTTLSKGTGICFDYASLFAAMCRSQGIPTRLVIGYADPNIYHAWNEVYTAETGWITPEIFLKKKGYNITDATFYSGKSDKEKIADYIANDKNYSAMYRY